MILQARQPNTYLVTFLSFKSHLSHTLFLSHSLTTQLTVMSMFDKFKKSAQKAGSQATIFIKDGSNAVANSTRDFAQGFNLPGEAEKAAKTLTSFLGECNCHISSGILSTERIAEYELSTQPILTNLSRHSTPYPRLCCNALEVYSHSHCSN